jgi:hypothetical protein
MKVALQGSPSNRTLKAPFFWSVFSKLSRLLSVSDQKRIPREYANGHRAIQTPFCFESTSTLF